MVSMSVAKDLREYLIMFLVTAAPFALRIACGSDSESYSPETGYLWSKDMNYTGGSSGNLTTVSRIASQLKTIRYFGMPDGSENCYNLSVPNGQYLIRYLFLHCEIFNAYIL